MRINKEQLDYRIETLRKLTGLELRYSQHYGNKFDLFIDKNHCPCPMIRAFLSKQELYEAMLVAGEILQLTNKKENK